MVRKSASVRLDYIIHVQEIAPWPPSQTLRSLRSVLIQWQNGERTSGSTKSVVPFLGSDVGEGKIEFNESFRLSATLLKDIKVKAGNGDVFQKNYLEFNLFEPRRDNIMKGQLIGTAMINLADYGVVDEPLNISTAMNCKRNFRNMAQPILYVKIQSVDKGRGSSVLRGSSHSKEVSLGTNDCESVIDSVDEEFAEEAEITFSTDDDGSSHSSVTASSAPLEHNDGSVHPMQLSGSDFTDNNLESSGKEHILASGAGIKRLNMMPSIIAHGTERIAVDCIPRRTEKVGSAQEVHRKVSYERTEVRSNDPKNAENGMLHCYSANEVSSDEMQGFDDDASGEANGEKRLTPETAANFLGNRNGYCIPEEENGRGPVRDTGGARYHSGCDRKVDKVYPKDTKRTLMDAKLQQLENKIQMVEGELRETAAIEVALYSVIAEHGGSTSKFHAPARRLSRFYRYAIRELPQASIANAGRSIVSGLFLVARACGSDVSRLTYWLSNSVVLRAIISQMIPKGNIEVPLSRESYPRKKGNKNARTEDDNENVHKLISELEKVEAWIFSRIVESLWWQSLTPYMQSSAAKLLGRAKGSGSIKNNRKVTHVEDQEQGNISVDLWKKAFTDACERLCPVRGGGHECGCLPVLAKLIMEHCVARLDVAMFNAILRESANEIPTDPVSDPISDPKVLPIPAGKSSFQAGAQLKNAIGNWSRWLTDLFGLDDDDSHGDATFKSFHLLHALSDLMMLPKGMLLSRSTRKEVCPTFGASLIKRVLDNFSADEFCPDPVPNAVLEALASEDLFEAGEELVASYPCIAANPVYPPPSVASVAGFLSELGNQSQLRRSRSSVLEKAQNSDDELDELNSPLTSIFLNESSSSSTSAEPAQMNGKGHRQQQPHRYQLLREVWMSCE
ncbi:uncharacterized protein LOC115741231 isoform X2 [Rhodamnia argentea]|uniref:Uncharacterized protein LOC115741231 isoform X2 n=1 Tax=Rhodamnia argentea TaxID=178133 RepID=A0A8B8P8D1_9MYRT|nr:uncharacterized protein LOC115741231 isoform X2 [Rhodamnia argentea]